MPSDPLSPPRPYECFAAWRACHDLTLAVYRTTRDWPQEVRQSLTEQVRSATLSAAANIVEGAGRNGSHELRRFLGISLGSLLELAYLLRLARELGYGQKEELTQIEELRNKAKRLTRRLYRAVSRPAGR